MRSEGSSRLDTLLLPFFIFCTFFWDPGFPACYFRYLLRHLCLAVDVSLGSSVSILRLILLRTCLPQRRRASTRRLGDYSLIGMNSFSIYHFHMLMFFNPRTWSIYVELYQVFDSEIYSMYTINEPMISSSIMNRQTGSYKRS